MRTNFHKMHVLRLFTAACVGRVLQSISPYRTASENSKPEVRKQGVPIFDDALVTFSCPLFPRYDALCAEHGDDFPRTANVLAEVVITVLIRASASS